jgi:two-component system, chemotaxis family, CheB/CheR fusion protein
MSSTHSLDRTAMQRRIVRMLSAFRVVAAHMANHRRLEDESALHLAGRIGAIGRAALADGYGMDLESLVLDELAAHAVKVDQYTVRGVDVHLHDAAAHMMSLAIHELATNSVKYGALSQPEARLRVLWWYTGDSEAQRLHFEWSEEGMELAPGAPRPVGFGSDLVQRLIARELNGLGELTFSPTGMRCVIEVPMQESPHKDE